ncbi:MAG TPA: hypothetical protein VJ780_06850, partial [Flavobacterium sp.]|nr:hypothetical protein [Flavobacterium sp.]
MNKRRDFLKKTIPLASIPLLTPFPMFSQETKENNETTIKIKRPKVIFFDINETLLNLEPLKLSIVKILGNK